VLAKFKVALLLTAAAVSLFALAAVSAGPAGGTATTGVNHEVTFISDVEQHTSFEVHDYGADTADRGNIEYHNFSIGLDYNADVVRVRVFSLNQANFAYQIPPGHAPYSGLWVVFGVKDSGEPGINGDELGFTTAPNQASACSIVNTSSVPPNQTITGGNIQVHS